MLINLKKMFGNLHIMLGTKYHLSVIRDSINNISHLPLAIASMELKLQYTCVCVCSSIYLYTHI